MSAARRNSPLTRFAYLVLVTLIAPVAPALAEKTEPDPLSIFGWVENIVIQPYGYEVKARIDTGANTASMQGENIEFFKRDGKKWVRFELEVELSHQDNDDDHPSDCDQARPSVDRHRFPHLHLPWARPSAVEPRGGHLAQLGRPGPGVGNEPRSREPPHHRA